MAALDPVQQERIVGAVIRITDLGLLRALPLTALGRGLPALSPEQRERIVDAVLGTRDWYYRAIALAGLGAGLAALTPERQERIVDAALGIVDERCRAFALARLAHVHGKLHARVFTDATRIGSLYWRANALAGLANGIAE
ncbi:hypothetical protein [Paraburkholderia sediminicola]|uniref:hypothetical protein n=1 Tax=Paraburkholderia sediminicola TaxID=458836 RepID=UPI0038B7AA58